MGKYEVLKKETEDLLQKTINYSNEIQNIGKSTSTRKTIGVPVIKRTGVQLLEDIKNLKT